MTTEPPKRRWFQFRLRTHLIAILVLSLPFSWFAWRMERARRQREAVRAIQQLKGQVFYHWQLTTPAIHSYARLNEPRTPAWIRGLLGEEYSDVVVVSLHEPGVHEPDLSVLKAFTNLRGLQILGTPLNDAGINHIAGLSTLDVLVLDSVSVTPEQEKMLRAALPACNILMAYSGVRATDAPQPLSR